MVKGHFVFVVAFYVTCIQVSDYLFCRTVCNHHAYYFKKKKKKSLHELH